MNNSKLPCLGKGREAVTYLVNKKYAMKKFKSTKSATNIEREGLLQKLASRTGLSPTVIKINKVDKYILMEKMDYHLVDEMKKRNGNLTKKQQMDIIHIYKSLDRIGIFHADSNIMNYMYKNGKLYIIDFGLSRLVDDKLIKQYNTDKPNMTFMLLGFVLKLKELNCPSTSYAFLAKYLDKEVVKKFDL